MVGSVSRAVFGRSLPAYQLLHVVTAAVGGACAVLLSHGIAFELGITPGTAEAIVLGSLLTVLALMIDIQLLPLPVPSSRTQVPADWRFALPSPIWVGGFGFLLGFTYLTSFARASTLAFLLAVGLAFESVTVVVGVGCAYGLIRAARLLPIPLVARTSRAVNAVVAPLALLGGLIVAEVW